MENHQQLNLFNFNRPYFKIDKPIRLIELFSGIGSQHRALEMLKVPFECWKTCEWAAPSIKGYNAIHIKDFNDYSKGRSKKEIIAFLQGNISTNYNEPCDVSKKSEKWLRDVYNDCIATHNLMNIMKVNGKDLEIVDTDKYCYIMTYSFPCQDLSIAGPRKGMAVSQAEGGTRSGLLWEVERILSELHKNGKASLPQVLLMENVPDVIGKLNVKHFSRWLMRLEELGYTSFYQVINGSDCMIPQRRKRCFMVSILGDYAYDFPLKLKLKYRLKDFLEKKVDAKYYLSKAILENYFLQDGGGFKRKNIFLKNINRDIAATITTHVLRPTDNFVACKDNHSGEGETDLDKIKIIKIGNYGNGHHAKDIVSSKGLSATITTGNHGLGQAIIDEEQLEKINSKGNHSAKVNSIIRKLTPKECLRLMGFQDKDYLSLTQNDLSDSAIYHCAGDSIITTCLASIISTMLPLNESESRKTIEDYVETLKGEQQV